MSRYVVFPIREWGGLNEDLNPNRLRDNELSMALNCWRRDGAIGTRPGTQREGSAEDYDARISGSPAIQGIKEFRRQQDARRDLIVIAGGDAYLDDTTTMDKTTNSVTITGGATNPWSFAIHKNTLYAAGGADSDNIWKLDGTGALSASSQLDVVTFQSDTDADGVADADIDAKYVFEWGNRLFLAGMDGSVPDDNPMVVRYSALNDGDTWPIGNTIGGSSAIGGLSADGDEFITGLNRYVDNEGDWLIVMTNKRLYSVTEIPDPFTPFTVTRRGAIANGCVSHYAYVNLGLDSGDAVYLSSSGIHSLRQSQQFGARQDSFLSWKIRETFSDLNHSRLDQARGAYWKEQGLVLFAVPSGSNAENNMILALDIKGVGEVTAETARWYVWVRNGADASERGINMLVPARTASDEWRVYAGNEKGDILRFTTDIYSDEGATTHPYMVHIRTKHNDYGAPGAVKGIGDVLVDVQPGAAYNILYRTVFDFGSKSGSLVKINFPRPGDVWGTGVWDEAKWALSEVTFRDKLYGQGSGDTIAHDFHHAEENQPFWIAGVAAQIRTLGEPLGEIVNA